MPIASDSVPAGSIAGVHTSVHTNVHTSVHTSSSLISSTCAASSTIASPPATINTPLQHNTAILTPKKQVNRDLASLMLSPPKRFKQPSFYPLLSSHALDLPADNTQPMNHNHLQALHPTDAFTAAANEDLHVVNANMDIIHGASYNLRSAALHSNAEPTTETTAVLPVLSPTEPALGLSDPDEPLPHEVQVDGLVDSTPTPPEPPLSNQRLDSSTQPLTLQYLATNHNPLFEQITHPAAATSSSTPSEEESNINSEAPQLQLSLKKSKQQQHSNQSAAKDPKSTKGKEVLNEDNPRQLRSNFKNQTQAPTTPISAVQKSLNQSVAHHLIQPHDPEQKEQPLKPLTKASRGRPKRSSC